MVKPKDPSKTPAQIMNDYNSQSQSQQPENHDKSSIMKYLAKRGKKQQVTDTNSENKSDIPLQTISLNQ